MVSRCGGFDRRSVVGHDVENLIRDCLRFRDGGI